MLASISGGADNDTLINNASFATINAGAGNDSIRLSNTAQENLIQYAAGDGSDTISGLNSSDTLSITGGEFAPVTVGNNLIVNVGDDSITLVDAARSGVQIVGSQKNFFRGTERADNMTNTVEGAIIAALGGNDTIDNRAANVSINAGADNDYIIDNWNNKVVFFHESGNDTIQGFGSNSTLKVAGGSYTSLVSDYYNLILIDSESGDSINILNGAYNSTINIVDAEGNPVTVGNALNIVGTELADNLSNTFDSATIRALGGDDTITNSGSNVSISGGAGNDSIDNGGVWSSIDAGAGDDSIQNSGYDVTISAGAGNDSVSNTAIQVTIDAGAGNDSIVNNASQVSINGGAGDDYLNNNGQLLTAYTYESGNDTIEGFNASDSLNVGGYSYSTVKSDDGIIVNVLNRSATVGTVTLKDYSGQYVNIVSTYAPSTVRGIAISNPTDSIFITGTAGNDTITNGGASVTITGNRGDDRISLSGGATNNLIEYVSGDGNDTVSGFNATSTLQIGDGSGTYATVQSGSDVIVRVGNGSVLLDSAESLGSINIDGLESTVSSSIIPLTEGDDTYSNYNNDVTIRALGGNDSVDSWSDNNVSIDGGADNDTINFNGINVTVTGGTGNDAIYDATDIAAHVYTGGNDTIYGFDRWSTIVIADSWSSVSGDDGIVIAVSGKGSLTLDDYWRDDINIVSSLDKVTHYNRLYSNGDNTTVTGTNDADHLGLWNDSVTVEAAGGGDYIYVAEANDSINVGDGDDTVRMYTAANTTVEGGTGNDYIRNENATQWNSATQQYETVSSPDNTTIDGGAGDDTINNYGSFVSINGGADNDTIENYGANVSISGTAGNDNINNYGSSVTIDGGAGTDTVWNYGNNVTIDGGADNDEIHNNNGSNVTMLGGTGNDEIYLSADSRNNFIRYADGDGNDTVWGITENDTLNLLADGYSTVEGRGDDLIVNVITNDVVTGSILLIGARNNPPHITLGESGTEGGGSSSGGDGGGSSSGGSGGGGGGRGGSGGGNTSGGTSASEGRGSAASGGRSASGSSGSQTSTGISSSSGRVSRYVSTNRKDSIASAAARNLYNEMTATNQQPANQLLTPTSKLQTVYTGGNQVISNYQSGEKIIFGADYTGAFYDAAGNFFAGSSTGALAIENAMDKVIDLSDAAGNDFVKAYAATTAGVIDGRGIAGFELINGSSGADAIYAGDGGSQLWGGADVATDILVGGGGSDIFIVSKYQGSDLIVNASSKDVVYLSDANLNDIIATEENNGVVAVAFNTGNVVAVQSSEALSSTFLLNDGSQYRYNHANKSWQTA